MSTATLNQTRPLEHRPPPTRPGPVLLAIGGREPAAPLRFARALGLDARDVVVLSVVDPMPVPVFAGSVEIVPVPLEIDAERLERQREWVRALVARTVDAPWRVEIRTGDAGDVVLHAAREHDVSLVVMGIGRHRPIDRLLAAETTIHVARRLDRPLLAVAGEARGPVRNAIVAMDFTPSSVCAAELAIPLLAPGATLHLVHAWMRWPIDAGFVRAQEDLYEREIPSQLEALARSLDVPPGITVREALVTGPAAEAVLEYARAQNADLVVAGRSGMGTLERLALGSVTSALLRGSTCSVLVGPPETSP